MPKFSQASRLAILVAVVGLCANTTVQAKPTKQETLDALVAEVIDAYAKTPCSQLAKGKDGGKSKNYAALRTYLIQNPNDRETFLNQVTPATIARLQQCKLL